MKKLICIRHGKPKASYPRGLLASWQDMNAAFDAYDASGLDQSAHEEPQELIRCFALSSDLPRARETASFLTGKSVDAIPANPAFREVPLPRFSPLRVRLPAGGFMLLARIGWLTGTMRGPESFSETMVRVQSAADYLEELAHKEGEIALFSHGFFLWLLGRELRRRRWTTDTGGPFGYLEKRVYIKSATGG
ncbi:MAG: histidine phosphatase family protein [Spirochaetia bacterium]|nr:histidine phosphatase family protein [Spirochaetia bacterium]